MMELTRTGRALANYVRPVYGLVSLLHQTQNTVTQVRCYAARKGYRDAAKKKKVKQVLQKQAWIPHNLRKKEDVVVKKRSMEESKLKAVDDVWLSRFFAWRVYDFEEAIACHRETHHPTIYNVPDAQVNLFMELDMRTEKPTKFVDKFRRMAIMPNVFEQDGLQERSILVFCKTPEQKEEALNAGATVVGGKEIIRDIEKGKVVLPDFRFVIAHPTILPEMVTIRGLLKRRFPSVRSGTLGPNLAELVTRFKNGVEYSCLKDDKQLDYGWIDTTIGRLNMDTEKLEENFKAMIDDINMQRPKREGPFITKVLMSSPPSVEKFKINLTPYMKNEEVDLEESSDEEEVEQVNQ